MAIFNANGAGTLVKNIEFPLTPAQVAAGRKRGQFLKLEDPRWDDFLDSVLKEDSWRPFNPPLSPALRNHLESRIGDDAAANQWKHALAATEERQSARPHVPRPRKQARLEALGRGVSASRSGGGRRH